MAQSATIRRRSGEVSCTLALLLLFAAAAVNATPAVDASEQFTRIAFGSCAVQVLPQPFWKQIAAGQPDIFIFAGDNVYGDFQLVDGEVSVGKGSPELLAKAYQALESIPAFQSFRQQIPVLATWDDHDYGENDGGVSYRHKVDAKHQFLTFWDVPAEDPRWHRGGIYHAQISGTQGRRVQYILLDTRYFRSDLLLTSDGLARRSGPPDASGIDGKYQPDANPDKTMLGEEQWQWLREELKKPAEVRLLVTSIQFIAQGHGWERWGNLPLERERLLNLLASTAAQGVVLLSGDRHRAALYRLDDDRLGYPLYEVTSSALNRPYPGGDEQGPYQLGAMFEAANYGTVDIDWQSRQLSLNIRDMAGRSVRSVKLMLEILKK